MKKGQIRRNDEFQMTKAGTVRLSAIGHSCFGFLLSFGFLGIRHCLGGWIFSSRAKNAHRCAASSMILPVGLPAPWPARVSMRIRMGASPAWAAWSAAAYLKLWAGTTRSSWSAVVMSVAGYLTPGLTLWSGEED